MHFCDIGTIIMNLVFILALTFYFYFPVSDICVCVLMVFRDRTTAAAANVCQPTALSTVLTGVLVGQYMM